VLTADHTPLFCRYDVDYATNPALMTRLDINSVFNAGAIEWEGNIVLMARVESRDRKSFFAVTESKTGVDRFEFWDFPVRMPELAPEETNLYDMRLVQHEDGWVYGLFCAERHDETRPQDLSAAIARCGIARTKDLDTWERLPSAELRPPPRVCGGKIRPLHTTNGRFRRNRNRGWNWLGSMPGHHQGGNRK
jgi:4-O-beta-D-mannosyl-D-glucose phosphorylase